MVTGPDIASAEIVHTTVVLIGNRRAGMAVRHLTNTMRTLRFHAGEKYRRRLRGIAGRGLRRRED